MKRYLESGWGAAVLVIAVVFSLYLNTLHNDFVLDDTAYIIENHLVKDWRNIPQFLNVPKEAVVADLSAGFMKGRNIRWVTYTVDYVLGGGSPVMFHVTNLMLHAATSILLLLLLRRFLQPLWSLLATLLFVAHPIQTNSVAYIFARKDLLATFFILLAIHAVLEFRKTGRSFFFVASFLFYLLGFFSKETAVVFPVLLLLFDKFVEARREDSFVAPLILHWRTYLFFGVATFGLLVRHLGFGKILTLVNPLVSWIPLLSPPEAQAFFAPYALDASPNLSFANLMLFYFAKMTVPVDLIVDYRDVFSFNLVPADLEPFSTIVVLLLFAALFKFRKSMPGLPLGIYWGVVALLPVSHIVEFHYPVAEHYLYLPMAGFCMAIGSVGERISKHSLVMQKIVVAGMIALLIVASISTVKRNMVWQNMESLTIDLLKKAPEHPRGLSTLVHVYSAKGEYGKALNHALNVIKIVPNSPVNQYNIGYIYEQLGQPARALTHYQISLSLQPNAWDSFVAIANLQFMTGDVRAGWQTLERLWQRYRYHPVAALVAGNQRFREGALAEARTFYQQAQKIDPALSEARLGLAVVLWVEGQQGPALSIIDSLQEKEFDWDWIAGQGVWGRYIERSEATNLFHLKSVEK